jgi:hypothetical protein
VREIGKVTSAVALILKKDLEHSTLRAEKSGCALKTQHIEMDLTP